MNPTKNEFDGFQKAAIAADANTVVSAGAGSGKTTVLAERYARLVVDRGFDVDSILTLTFTRKAAAEMYARIHGGLAADPSRRAAEQLERFDKARISTLDAFCASIARGGCHRYGVPPDFSVDEKRLERVADSIAVEMLMEYRELPALRRLVAVQGFDRLRFDLFVDLARKRIGVVNRTDFIGDAGRRTDFVSDRLDQLKAEIEKIAEEILAIDEEGGTSLPKAQAALRSILPLPAERDEESLRSLSAAARLLSSKDSWSTPGSNSRQPGLILLRDATVRIKQAAKELPSYAFTLLMADDATRIAEVLDDFGRRFTERKKREGVLSFRDAAELAFDILLRDTALRAHYKRSIRSIMIDEFQDDDELQKNLLYLLAEREDRSAAGIPNPEDLREDALFFVGDEKQSIYRFRGADVSVFRRLASELSRSTKAETALELALNYRSSPALVSFFNGFFPGVFGEAGQDFEARFSRILSPVPIAEHDFPASAVEFHILEPARGGEEDAEDAELSTGAIEAFAAARRIERGVRSGEFDYGDVAVLFRSSSRQHEYERAFRMIGIPVAASDPRGVFLEGPANDIYSALRLILYPGDRNAYAAFLRSPFVRLGDDALARILLSPRADPFVSPADPAWFGNEDDERRFRMGGDLYLSLRSAADKNGSASLVSRLWYDEGYRIRLLSDPDAASCLGHFDLLLDLALDADRRRLSLSAFLDELSPLMGSADKIEAGDAPDEEGAVRLMTVHKSKGLEFPVVVIADAGNTGRGSRNDAPYYFDPEFGPAVNLRFENSAKGDGIANVFYESSKRREEELALAELRRLLYVAATRAERKLLVFETRTVTKEIDEALSDYSGIERAIALLRHRRVSSKDGSFVLKSFADLVAAGLSDPAFDLKPPAVFAVEPLGERERRAVARAVLADRESGSADSVASAAGRRAALEEFYALPPMTVTAEAPRRFKATKMDETAAFFRLAGQTPVRYPGLPIDSLLAESELEKAFGTLCHLEIEQALISRTKEPPRDLQDAFARARLGKAELSMIRETARRLAENFLGSELARAALLSPRRRSEFPFMLALPGGQDAPVLIRGTMDLVFESGGRCVVVDFKTDRQRDPSIHAIQMAVYRAAAPAFSRLPVQSWLFYLRGAEAVLDQDGGNDIDLATLARETLPESLRSGESK
ncbi:MAG: hypothetical protein A2Z99_15340 [Treponema sp. GWB1_62_6]|nr:MAG: hypothetical protein A2Z99_15340 [Treponema sp. GWB1_62_6]